MRTHSTRGVSCCSSGVSHRENAGEYGATAAASPIRMPIGNAITVENRANPRIPVRASPRSRTRMVWALTRRKLGWGDQPQVGSSVDRQHSRPHSGLDYRTIVVRTSARFMFGPGPD
jgi:hypothetical protein